MNKDTLLKIGIGVAIVAVIIIVVLVMGSGSNNQNQGSSLTSATGESVSTTGQARNELQQMSDELLNLLRSLEGIRLNNDVFTNPAFDELRDITIPVPDDGVTGRRNPFAPLGNETLQSTTSTTQDNALILPFDTSVDTTEESEELSEDNQE